MGESSLLAKPDVPLLVHLRETTEQGRELARRLGLSPELERRVVLACAFHDLGKATRSFQEHVRGQRGKAYPHALASLPFVLTAELRGLAPPPLAAAAVVSHHSPLGPEVYKGYGSPDYHPELPAFLQVLLEYLREQGVEGVPSVQECLALYHRRESPAGLLDTPLPFGEKTQSLRGRFQQLPTKDFADVKAVLHLADWLVSGGRETAESLFLRDGKGAIDTFVRQQDIKLRDFQQRASDQRGKRLWLRAPTGTGKTEALLLWAGNAERLLYLLPTQATVNAMWRRLREIYGAENVGLAHGKAGYILRKEVEEDPLDLRLFASVFAKPVVVATLDQYLLAHLRGRHWEERLALARRATVVLDEIHSYEPYTLGLLLEALKREPPARLALASATLPEALLNLFDEAPLVEGGAPLWERRRHRLRMRNGPLAGALGEILACAREGKTVLVIANTVNDAQSFYQALREQGGERVRLLHSRFTFRDRQRKEDQLARPEPGTILVATQIVEVSLDISYDLLFTEVAPVDALVQRMGRVNRKGKQPPAPVFIFQEWSRGSEKIYGGEILSRSRDLLESLPEEPADRDWVDATHSLYEETVSQPSYRREIEEGRGTLTEVQKVLGCYTINLSDEEMRAKFTTRRGPLSIEVLPEVFRDEAFAFIERNERWRLVELLVPVPVYWLAMYAEWFSLSADLDCYITVLPYSEEVGLSPPGEGETPGGAEIW
ncbi:MAG: CRISPR-associated helicase Cas3' [Bacillota bacterium]